MEIKTINRNGRYTAALRNSNILDDSDEFFRNEQNIIVIPRGTITVQETKAPKGYKVDPKVYTYKVDQDTEDLSMQFNFGNTPEQPNKPASSSRSVRLLQMFPPRIMLDHMERQ